MKIRITNKKAGGAGHYVGRPSPLGNPSQYRDWLKSRLEARDQR